MAAVPEHTHARTYWPRLTGWVPLSRLWLLAAACGLGTAWTPVAEKGTSGIRQRKPAGPGVVSGSRTPWGLGPLGGTIAEEIWAAGVHANMRACLKLLIYDSKGVFLIVMKLGIILLKEL